MVGKLDDAGYTRTEDKDAASVGIQLSHVRKVTYFAGDYPLLVVVLSPTTGLPATGATG
ncbi:MAG: hypothetical protein ACLUYV_06125 [Alistipes shahii]